MYCARRGRGGDSPATASGDRRDRGLQSPPEERRATRRTRVIHGGVGTVRLVVYGWVVLSVNVSVLA